MKYDCEKIPLTEEVSKLTYDINSRVERAEKLIFQLFN